MKGAIVEHHSSASAKQRNGFILAEEQISNLHSTIFQFESLVTSDSFNKH